MDYSTNNNSYILDLNDEDTVIEKKKDTKRKKEKKVIKIIGNRDKHRSFNKDLLQLLIILVTVYLLFSFVIMSVRINGVSMEPTYQNGDRGVMLRTTIFNYPSKYDAVVIDGKDAYQEDGDKKKMVIKRVIGVENDSIEIKNNMVYVNGEEIEDKYKIENATMSDHPLTYIPEGYVFVLGDNRNNSKDSRSVGLIKTGDIKAVHGIRFWPINKIGLMK